MTGGSTRDDADLPIIDAVEPFGAELTETSSAGSGPSSRGDGGSRSPRPRLGPRQGAGIAAAALALLVIGIAVGGFSLAPDPTATPRDSALQTPDETPAVSEASDTPCQPPRPGQLPPVTMSSTDSPRLIDGLFTYGSGHRATDGPLDWRIPALAAAARPAAGSRLEFHAGQQTCFHHLRIEYLATAAVADGSARVWLDAGRPPTGTIAVDLLPEGDWLVRVTAQFDPAEPSSTASIDTVTDFRVIVGGGPVVTDPPATPTLPRPDRTPAVPCGTVIPSPDIGVELVASDGQVTLGSAAGGDLAADATIRPGDSLQVIVEGEACAVAWNLSLVGLDQTEGLPFDSYSGATDNPAIGAQNRWTVPGAFSEAVLTANLRFPGGLEIARYWRIFVADFAVPSLFLVGSDGTRFEASAGCNVDIRLSNGYDYNEGCPNAGYVEDPDALDVAALSVIHLDMPGWVLSFWSATCGHMSDDGLNYEVDAGGCGLGAGASDTGGALAQAPAFLLHPGDHIVEISVWATDSANNSFSTTYYAHVVAR